MPLRAVRPVLLALLAATAGPSVSAQTNPDPNRAPAPAPPSGLWKLVVQPTGDDEFYALRFDPAAPARARILSSQIFLGSEREAAVEARDGVLVLTFPALQAPRVFRGRLAGDGPILGTFQFKGNVFPARLQKARTGEVAPIEPSEMEARVNTALRRGNPLIRIAELGRIADEAKGHPSAGMAYEQILENAEAAGLKVDELRGYVDRWLADLRPYGPDMEARIRMTALDLLDGRKPFAALSLDLAKRVDPLLGPETPTEVRALVAQKMASSARLADRPDDLRAAEARLRELDLVLDAEARERIPPFKPEPYAGREPKGGDRVVLMELFTGSECPPCVASDIGFDALLKSFRPTELIGLQYHIHHPAPDPLTAPDAMARAGYYGDSVTGTPASFFDGKVGGQGGGFLIHARDKFDDYRKVVEPRLNDRKRADLTLTATRDGDEVRVAATAAAPTDAAADARPRLRIALVEREVRYVGGNRLRFHHNVVRGFVGGPEGTPLEAGKAEVDAAVNLADLRKGLEDYLSEFSRNPENPPFTGGTPPIDLDDLAVVAFVQDDRTREVWHATQVTLGQ